MLISASFTFEAETIEEAQAIVATWTVTPGVTLLGLSGTVQGSQRPVTVRMGGTVGGALLSEAQRSVATASPAIWPAPGGPYEREGVDANS